MAVGMYSIHRPLNVLNVITDLFDPIKINVERVETEIQDFCKTPQLCLCEIYQMIHLFS